jgi:hypothetical protein
MTHSTVYWTSTSIFSDTHSPEEINSLPYLDTSEARRRSISAERSVSKSQWQTRSSATPPDRSASGSAAQQAACEGRSARAGRTRELASRRCGTATARRTPTRTGRGRGPGGGGAVRRGGACAAGGWGGRPREICVRLWAVKWMIW